MKVLQQLVLGHKCYPRILFLVTITLGELHIERCADECADLSLAGDMLNIVILSFIDVQPEIIATGATIGARWHV